MDSQDGFINNWHDLRKDLGRFSTRQHGGASVMVWGPISFYGLSPIMFLERKKDFKKYCQTLQAGLMPWSAEVFGESQCLRFQQDNAPIHTSTFTRNWLREQKISTMNWPPKSSDINIVENLLVGTG